MTRFNPTERIGVSFVERFFLKNGWIPRAISQSDVGIDMEVEIADAGKPSGQLLAIQIKSGISYFKNSDGRSIIYRLSETHGDYWIKHCLPVLIIIYDPDNNKALWQQVTDQTIIKTGTNYKIEIPKENELNRSSLSKLTRLNKYPVYVQRLQRLSVQLPLIRKIKSNENTVIEVEEWINKLIGRATITIKQINDDGEESTISNAGYIFFKGIEDLEVLFPWADFFLDEEYYEDSDEDLFKATYGEHPPFGFREFRETLPEVRAIESNGEVNLYRFVVTLNKTGRSFLQMNKYLEGGHQTKLRYRR